MKKAYLDKAKVKKVIDNLKYCNSSIAFHICKKHPEDCDYIVDLESLKRKLRIK